MRGQPAEGGGVMEAGLKFALLAMSFYRGRHGRRPRFANPTRRTNRLKTVSVYDRYCQLSRAYIVRARAAGFRGQVNPWKAVA